MKFLFFIERELHIPIFKPVWEYIRNNSLGESAFFTLKYSPPNGAFPGIGIPDDLIKKIKKQGVRYSKEPYKFRPDITFIADHSYQYVEGLGKVVNIGHGTISKGYYYLTGGLSRRENLADLMCVPGNIHKEYLSQCVYKPIQITGMPKLDVLCNNEINKSEYLKKFYLNPDNRTILFAPTFNQELSILPHVKTHLRDFINKKFNIIIKLHGATGIDVKETYKLFAELADNAHYSEKEDISLLFLISDILISDVSSVIYEFSVLNKPILLFDSPLMKTFVNYNPDDIEYKYRNIGITFNDIEKLNELLKKTDENNTERIKISEDFISIRNGKGSQNVVETAIATQYDNKDMAVVLYNSKGKPRYNFCKYKSKYQIIKVKDESLKDVKDKLKNVLNDKELKRIVFYDSNYTASPFIFECLNSHFYRQKDLDVISALSMGEKIDNLQIYSLGIQLGYEFIAEKIKSENLFKQCFCINKNILSELDLNNIFSIEDLLIQINKHQYEKYLALDAIVYRKECEETLDENGFPVSDMNSIYLNLALLDEHFEGNILKNILELNEIRFKDKTEAFKARYYTDLGSMYENIHKWEKAVFYLNEALKHTQSTNTNDLSRIYFHLGVVSLNLKDNENACGYLKQCLQINPEHNKAKEILSGLFIK